MRTSKMEKLITRVSEWSKNVKDEILIISLNMISLYLSFKSNNLNLFIKYNPSLY